jgi:pyridoxal phosphate enzyme (YggS family)
MDSAGCDEGGVDESAKRGGFKSRLQMVLERIERAARRAGRDPAGIKLVAASKSVPVECLREAVACGCRTFGENRVQEALAKMDALGRQAGVEWHLIGPLQSNKVKAAVGRFSMIHAVDRIEVAERLDRMARERKLVQAVLLEVNVAGEKTKHGFSPDDLVSAAERIGACAGVRVLGLMVIPPPAASGEEGRPYFRQARDLANRVEALGIPGVSMTELSMGMSADYEVAIEEGATMVRIGTALFGPRP